MTVHVYPQPRDGAGPFAAAILGLIICVVALPVVLLLGGPLLGWFVGTLLWVINWTASNMMTKFALNSGQKAAVGVAGVSMMGRAFTVVIILYIIAARISHPIGLTAAAGLPRGVLVRPDGPRDVVQHAGARAPDADPAGPRRLMTRARFRAAMVAASAGLLAIPAIASANAKFDPSTEFKTNAVHPI